MVEFHKASLVYSRAKRYIEEQEKNKAIEKFTILFNREVGIAANNGELGCYIPKESFPLKYCREIIDMLLENGYEVREAPILSSFLISWADAEEDEEDEDDVV